MEINLKKGAWHYRLQHTIFGEFQDFNNFCPYFWLTMFCIAVSPFCFSFYAFKWVATNAIPYLLGFAWVALRPVAELAFRGFELFFDLLDRSVCLPMERAALEYLDERRLVTLYENSRYSFKRDGMSDEEALQRLFYYRTNDRDDRKRVLRMDKKFQLWKDIAGDSWEEKLSKAKQEAATKKVAEREEQDRRRAEREEAVAKAEVTRRKMLNNIVIWTKRLTPYLLGIIGLGGLYLLCRMCVWMPWIELGKITVKMIIAIPVCIVWFFWQVIKIGWDVVTHLWKMGPMFSRPEKGMMMALPFVGAILMKISRKCDLEIGFVRGLRRFADALGKLVFFLGRPFEYVVLGLVEFVKFVAEYVVLFKKDHCPKINWE